MKSYTFKKFLADLAILGFFSITISSLIYLTLIFVLLNAVTYR